MTPRPFPWTALRREERTPTRTLAALRELLKLPSAPARAVAALGDLVGSPIDLTAEALGHGSAATVATNTVALRLSGPPDTTGSSRWWALLEVEVPLVVRLVAGVTKRLAPRVPHPDVLTPAMVGSFAAIVAAAVRRAGVPVVVTPASATSLPAEDVCTARFAVSNLDETTRLRAFFPGSLLSGVSPSFDRSRLTALGDLPIELPVVGCRTVATAAEVAALRVGDAWVLGPSWCLGRLDAPLQGTVWLCSGLEELAVPADLEAGRRIVLRDCVEELSWSPMGAEATECAGLVEAVGEVPVVVRVEIGVARMKAKEWSALRAGDVVGLGSSVGGPVTLRVSGVAVAQGDLVDLDGEVGVRIRRRLAGEPA